MFGSCCLRSITDLDMKSFAHCILFGVEHDERHDTLVQTMINVWILLPSIHNRSRHEVIAHCILFGVEHDEPLGPCLRNKSYGSKLYQGFEAPRPVPEVASCKQEQSSCWCERCASASRRQCCYPSTGWDLSCRCFTTPLPVPMQLKS